MEREFPIKGYGEIHLEVPPRYAELYKIAGSRGQIVVDYDHNHNYGLATVESFNQETEEITVSFTNAAGEVEFSTTTFDEYRKLKKFYEALMEKRQQGSNESLENKEQLFEKIITHNLKLLTSTSSKSYGAHQSEYNFFLIEGKNGPMHKVRAAFQFDPLTGEIISFGKEKSNVPVERLGDTQTGAFEIVLDMAGLLLKTKESLEAGRHNAFIIRFHQLGKPFNHDAAKVLAQTIARFNEQYGTDFSEEIGEK